MQRNRKLKARILSLALSVAMVTTMMPATALAAEGGNVAPGISSVSTIQSFDKLEDRFIPSVGENAPSHVYGLTVELNTPFEDLNLPDELTAMVARTTTVSKPAEDEPVVDSGKPDTPAEDEIIPDEDTVVDEDTATDDTVSGNQPASPSDAKEEVKEEIKDEDVPLAPEPEQDEETTVTTVEQETISVTWKSDKEYKSDENGKFIYTAVLQEGFTLARGVELPQIYVYVGRQARAAQSGEGWSIENGTLTISSNAGTTGWQNSGVQGSAITNIVLTNDVTEIGEMAFSETAITSINIPDSVTSIGFGAFQACRNLTSVTIPADVTTISEALFQWCTSLTSVTIPDSVTSIEGGAFTQCSNLTSVIIPNNVTRIGDDAFANCGKLTTVTVETATPPTMGYEPFANLPSNFKIIVPAGKGDIYKAAAGWSAYAANIEEAAGSSLAHDIGTDGSLTLSYSCTCTESAPHVVSGSTNTNTIMVTTGTHYVTLDDVSISASTASAFNIQGGTVHLTLAAGTTNTLTGSGMVIGALDVKSAILDIDGSGALTASGGMGKSGITVEDSSITINGGTINANGGIQAPGIGNGVMAGGPLGSIVINGGTVTATAGGANNSGIGGVKGTVAINGGAVTAIGTPGIGGGNTSDPELEVKVTIGNNATVVAVSPTAGGSLWKDRGILAPSGGTIANIMAFDFATEMPSGTVIEIKDSNGQSLSPAVAYTPTANFKSIAFSVPDTGSYTAFAGSLKITGSAGNTFTVAAGLNTYSDVTANNPLAHDMSTGNLTMEAASGGTTGCKDGCSESNQHIATGTGLGMRIEALSGTHYVTLDGVSIESNQDTFIISFNTTVYLNLKDGTTNTSKGNHNSGIAIAESGTLIIDGNTGILNATGGDYMYGAGISCENGSTITIRGGVVNATGGENGAGIGGIGSNSSSGYPAGNITISGGTVTAIGKNGGAGIGGGGGTSRNGGAGGTINISGGIINATGGADGGAGIGGGAGKGNGGNVGNITISNGTVTATGGSKGGVGIGGGASGSSYTEGGTDGNITISGGTVTATGGTGATCSVGIGIGTKNKGQSDSTAPGTLSGTTVTVSGGTVITTGKSKAVNTGTLTLTGTAAKYKVGGAYTGATNFNSNILYEGTTQTTEAKDVKLLPTGTQAGNVSSTPTSKTSTQVVLAAVTPPAGEAIEYAYSTSTTAPVTGWQDSTTFTGLTANTTYYFFARIKANDKHWEGAASTGTAIKTDMTDAQKVAAAKLLAQTALGNLTATNNTTADDVMTAVNNALSSTGVTAAWKIPSDFNKILATESAAGSITGTIEFTLNSEKDETNVNLPIAKLVADKTDLTNAIADANNAKIGISINNASSPSSVSNGTKYVSDAEMKALTDAIAAAQAVANNATATIAEVTAAAEAMTAAVNTFKAAIKTGTYISSGGGGGGSSSNDNNNAVIVPPSNDKPNTPTVSEVKTPATVDSKGNATVVITEKNMTDAVDKAISEAKKNGTQANGVSVQFVVSTGGKTVNSLSVNLPKVTQEKAINGKVQEMAVIMEGTNITVGFNLAAVTEINKQAQADVQLTTTRLDGSKLSADAKAAIGNRPVFDIKATYSNGSKSISSLGSGQMMIEIPYKLQNGEVAGNLYGIYVDDNGKANYLTNSSYDAKREVLIIGTNHNSVYGVGYKATAPAFTDITNHWAKNSIEFVAARGLLNGTSNTTFAPNTTMTRGMFMTALGRLAGIDTSSYKTGKFTDVAATAYYAPYVNWAADKGIVSGTSATTFAPDAAITREQMAVIMVNYAKVMGYTVPKTREEVKFADAASIGSYAADAVKAMQMAGIINGKNNNTFDPKASATRAEVSAVLHRYVELVIDRSTAQGLDTNDSGSAMMYENGKMVKSASRTVGSATYNFNANGEAILLPADN